MLDEPAGNNLLRENTALKHARTQDAIKEKNELYQGVLTQAPYPILVINPDRSIQYVNEAFEDLTGFTASEIIGATPPYPWWPADDEETIGQDLATAMVSGAIRAEEGFRKKDGTAFTVEITSRPVTVEGEMRYYLANWVDITDRKNAETALQRNEAYMRSVFRVAPTGIGVVRNRVIHQANDKFCEMVGYDRSELIGQSARIVYASDAEFERVGKEKYEQIRKTGTGTVETAFQRRDGRLIDVLLSSTPLDLRDPGAGVTFTALDITAAKQMAQSLKHSESKYRTMMEALKDPVYICSPDHRVEYVNPAMAARIGRDATGERCYRALHGFEGKCPWCCQERVLTVGHAEMEVLSPLDNRSYNISSSVFTGDRGEVFKISVFRDITDVKQLENQLQQAQKMEAIGSLAGGIAHDFNNILFPIVGLAELVKEDLPAESPLVDSVEQIYKAGLRGRDLVKQILAFSRQSEHRMLPIKIQQVLKEVVKLSRSTIPANIVIKQDIQDDCGLVMADPSQIHQVAMNLITNAFHAMEASGGEICIRLSTAMDACAVGRKTEGPLHTGSHAVLTVADTGHGMPPETLEKIFDPYFTTKPQGKGTGLGLSVVYGIIREHRGEVRVSSEVDRGTLVEVRLPLIPKSSSRNAETEITALPTGGEHILLVDDEPTVAKLESQMLTRLGYRVTTRFSSIDALDAFRGQSRHIDLVITDMTMPHMTGAGLARELIAARPDIPIIICTGFSDSIDETRAAAMGIRGFLMKPVVKSDLAAMVRRVLDGDK